MARGVKMGSPQLSLPPYPLPCLATTQRSELEAPGCLCFSDLWQPALSSTHPAPPCPSLTHPPSSPPGSCSKYSPQQIFSLEMSCNDMVAASWQRGLGGWQGGHSQLTTPSKQHQVVSFHAEATAEQLHWSNHNFPQILIPLATIRHGILQVTPLEVLWFKNCCLVMHHFSQLKVTNRQSRDL